MRHSHFVLFILLTVLLFTVLLGVVSCSAFQTETSADVSSDELPATSSLPAMGGDGPVEITDFLGFTSTIESSDRIVSLAPSCTEVLMAVDAENRIIAVDESSEDLIPGTETAGDYTDPDIEKITALEPDLVVAANYIQDDAINQMRELGLTVIAAEPNSWDEVPESFDMIAKAVGREDAGKDLVQKLTNSVEEVQREAPSEPISCYYVLSYGNAGNWTSGEGSFINTMLTYAGGAPITSGTASRWLEYPIEDLAAHDPECIILASAAGTVEDFARTPGYSELSAVRNGNVYVVDESLVSIPGPSLTEGLQSLSGILQSVQEDSAAA